MGTEREAAVGSGQCAGGSLPGVLVAGMASSPPGYLSCNWGPRYGDERSADWR